MPQYNQPASRGQLEALVAAMQPRNFHAQIVRTKADALEALKQLIPAQVSVMTGSSTTLHQIGFMDYLDSGKHPWHNVHADITAESNDIKRNELRRHSVTADYFIASANAVTQEGHIVAVDNSGSRVGALPFAAKNVVLVIGNQKLTQDIADAMQRIREHVFPQEDQRMLNAYNMHSGFGKWVILENEVNPNRIHVILVKEPLGF